MDLLECFETSSQLDVFHVQVHICWVLSSKHVVVCGLREVMILKLETKLALWDNMKVTHTRLGLHGGRGRGIENFWCICSLRRRHIEVPVMVKRQPELRWGQGWI